MTIPRKRYLKVVLKHSTHSHKTLEDTAAVREYLKMAKHLEFEALPLQIEHNWKAPTAKELNTRRRANDNGNQTGTTNV